MAEATTLPTKPQPLPQVFVYSVQTSPNLMVVSDEKVANTLPLTFIFAAQPKFVEIFAINNCFGSVANFDH